MEFHGKTVVVTGGGRGLGRHVARSFAEKGASVVIAGRDADALSSLQTEFEISRYACIAVQADLSLEAGAKTLAEAVEKRFGAADVVVAAAGQGGSANDPVVDTPPSRFEEMLRGNFMTTVLPVRALLSQMISRRSGKIVVISGVFGIRGRAGRAASSSAKWAVEGFVRSLALEVGVHNINVNCVCPGYVEGPRMQASIAAAAARTDRSPEDVLRYLEQQTALGRFSTPSDIAGAVEFLASERSRNITGQDIVVDAGWTL